MSLPRSPTSRENPIYFGIFADPSRSAFVTPEEALATLSDVARNVESKLGVGGGRKRRSFREFLTDSMKRGSKKDRTQSCSAETEEEIADLASEDRLISLVRSTSLDTKAALPALNKCQSVTVPPMKELQRPVEVNIPQPKMVFSAMNEVNLRPPKSPPSPHLYYNERNIVLPDRPPRPPERNQSSQLKREELKIDADRQIPEESLLLEIKPDKVSTLRRNCFLFLTEKVDRVKVYITFEGELGESRRLLTDENVHRLNEQALQILVPLEVFSFTSLPKTITVELISTNDDSVLLCKGTVTAESWNEDLRQVLESLCSVSSLDYLFSSTFAQNRDDLDAKLSNLISAIYPIGHFPHFCEAQNLDKGKRSTTLLHWATSHRLESLSQTLQKHEVCTATDSIDQPSFTKVECRSASSPEMTSHFASVQEQPENSLGTLVAEHSTSQEEAIYDVPRPSSERQSVPPELAYLPMQQISDAGSSDESKETPPLRRSCSASVVYIPPSAVARNASLRPTMQTRLPEAKRPLRPFGRKNSKPSLPELESSSRPQSRQEILNSFCLAKESVKKDDEGEKPMDVDEEEPVKELWGLRTFSPPPTFSVTTSVMPRASLFETCQAELIELQHQFKREMLSLKEVEEKFESWKQRPELPLAKDRRQEELERMREEWLRLQQLVEVKDREERKVWGLLRGFMTRKGGRRKTTSGCSLISNSSSLGGEEALLVSSPEKAAEGDLASPVTEDSKSVSWFPRCKGREMSAGGGPFYAVAAGRQVGIFRSWDECSEQVRGFKGAKYKKFDNEEMAIQFLGEVKMETSQQNDDSTRTSKRSAESDSSKMEENIMRPSTPSKKPLLAPSQVTSQTVRELHSLRKTVEDISSSIKDFMEVKGKEISAIKRKIDALLGAEAVEETPQKDEEKDDIGSLRKRLKTEAATGSAEINRLREEGFVVEEDGFVQVFTDGACGANGYADAKAGIGVWWNHDHKLNISAPLSSEQRHTNNVAEIQAAIEAIKMAKASSIMKLCVNTDSQFMINCMTQWISGWRRNGWRTKLNEPVKNKEELVVLDNLLSADKNFQLRWNHVRGHCGVEGNEQADELARKGAKM